VLIETDVERYLSHAAAGDAAATAPGGARAAHAFDLVFLDPPFGQNWLPRILPQLQAGAWVAPGGLIYLECERALGQPALPDGWEMLRSKSAGEVGYHLARVHCQVTQ
jgi:16S rRNA (guanine966-N2)-methyltransferase